jgi:hypothetical protein
VIRFGAFASASAYEHGRRHISILAQFIWSSASGVEYLTFP